MTEPPRISIGLPVYNGASFLAAAIDSVLDQTYTDIELILSDNGSTDATPEICQRYAARDCRVRYYREAQNRGAAWNFNRVVELATGEFFKWQAADDLIEPTFLERCSALLDHDPRVVLAMSRAAVIDDQGTPLEALPTGRESAGLTRLTDAVDPRRWELLTSPRADRRYRGVLNHSIRCYEEFGLLRRSAMNRTGGHRPYRGAEKVFLAEMALAGPFAEVPEVLFLNRWHRGRFSALESVQAQVQWVNPAKSGRFCWPRQFRCTLGYLWAIGRMPMRWRERLGCVGSLLAFVSRLDKWRAMFGEALRGNPMSAAVAPEPVARTSVEQGKPARSAQSLQASK